MKKLFVMIMMSLPFSLVAQSDIIRTLLVGNSMTYRNDMFKMYMNMTDDVDPEFILTEAIAGGSSLSDRWKTYTYCKDSVMKGNHDFVTIQEYSSTPAWSPGVYYRWAVKWDSLVREYDGTPVHWMNPAVSGRFDKYMGIIDSITTLIGMETGSLVAPIGLAWHKVVEDYNDTSYLYEDYIHPTYDASYLNACVLYATFTGESPIGLLPLEADSAEYLQTVAWEVYQDYTARISAICKTVSLSISADITDTYNNEGAIDITVTAVNSSGPYKYSWDNGSTSEDLYNLEAGSYSVKVRDKNGCSISNEFTVSKINSTRGSLSAELLNIYPNPVKNYLTIQSSQAPTSATIYSSYGSILSYHERLNTINVSDLSNGIYIISINIENSIITRIFIKE